MRRALALLLAFALLSGWQAALLHPLRHVDADGALVHLEAGGHRAPAGKDDGARRLGCEALAALTSCVGSHASAVIAATQAPGAAVAGHAPAAIPSAPVVYLSQAPPSLLN